MEQFGLRLLKELPCVRELVVEAECGVEVRQLYVGVVDELVWAASEFDQRMSCNLGFGPDLSGYVR